MYTALIKKFKNDDQGRTTTFTQKKICPKKNNLQDENKN